MTQNVTLASLVETYILETELKPDSERQLRWTIGGFAKWLAFECFSPCVCSFDASIVNQYLIHLRDIGRAPKTRRNHRQQILMLWQMAFDRGLIAERPERIRRVSCPQTPPRAMTIEEAKRLLATADGLRGRYRAMYSGIEKAPFWRAFLLASWDGGLRLGDMLDIERDSIDAAGYVSLSQNKTGRVHRVLFRPETIAAIDATFPPDRRRVWPVSRDWLCRGMKSLAEKAGMPGVTTRWIRRAFASYIERDNPGQAWRSLGHSQPGLDRKHYIDPRIAYGPTPLPPEIG